MPELIVVDDYDCSRLTSKDKKKLLKLSKKCKCYMGKFHRGEDIMKLLYRAVEVGEV